MYETFYGLREKPFSLVPDPDFLFLGRLHGAALNMLEYGLRGEASFTLISGEVGCGKTILIRRFLRMVDDSTTVGMVTNTPRSKGYILERILLAFDLTYQGKSEVEQYETLINFLKEQQTRGRRTVLIIDEAHNLDEDSLEELRMLSNINVDKSLALQVILVGQPEILDLLNTRSLRQLAQRISVNFKLLPLTFSETRRYIRHRLRVAGGSPDIFEPDAIAAIYLLADGIPRPINILCDTALVYGFGEGRETLDAAVIQAVASDMLRGGLDTLPAIDDGLVIGDILETADKLAASLDPDEQDDEIALQLLPLTPVSEAGRTARGQDNRDNSERYAGAGQNPDSSRTVIPIVDTSENGPDGIDSRRMILMLAIVAAVAVIAGGLLWFFWPADERTRAVLDDGISGSRAIVAPTTLADSLGRSGAGEDDFGAALAGLFERWKHDFSTLAGAAPCNKALNAGLSCYEREGNLNKLIRLNRPAIIELRGTDRATTHALLAGRKGNKVRLLIHNFEIMAPRDEVNSLMTGSFLLLWRPPPGFEGLLVEGWRGETVVWLRAELRKILGDNANVGEGDVFDAAMTQAVREFQERHGLQVDGLVGIETLIKINSASLGDEVPRLE